MNYVVVILSVLLKNYISIHPNDTIAIMSITKLKPFTEQ